MRLVHLSDLHLGFRAYLPTDRGWNQRERDLAAAFRWALQETVRLKPDLVLITGDLFDNPNPPSTAFLTLHRGVSHLRNQLPGVPILMIAGERDSPRNPADPGPVGVLDTLSGVEAAASAPRAVRFRNTRLHALLVPFRSVAQPPFPEVRPDLAADWNVLLIRGEPSASESAIPVDPSEWSYVAVGGDHGARAWAPNVRCAGALERPGLCPWSEATEEKGFLSVDLEEGAAEFHAAPARPVVDLAPIRVARGNPEPGTRRLRELLHGVPGGIEGKILRVRLRGDVVAPGEGVAQGLLDAVRRRAAHLEVHVESGEAAAPMRDQSAWKAQEILVPGSEPILVRIMGQPSGITLLTSRSGSSRREIADALCENGAADRRGIPLLRKLRVAPSPPDDPLLAGLWAGGRDPALLLRRVLLGLRDFSASNRGSETPRPGKTSDGHDSPEELEEGTEALRSRVAELTDRRADWVEASGDFEVATLQWAQERQDADSKLQAYRARAEEIRARLRALEAEGGSAECPTCGRTLGTEFGGLQETLRGEWENVVQDGRWWKRRREQLDDKPEELRTLEAHALRLQVRVEEAAEALERLKERQRGLRSSRSVEGPHTEDSRLPRELVDDSVDDPAFREVLRLAGSLLSRITEGRIVGVGIEDELEVIGADGRRRTPTGIEEAALRLATHLALWLYSRSKTRQMDSLLIWELHEALAYELFPGALDVLSDAEQFDVPILLIAPPSVLERVPEVFREVLELAVDDEGRPEFRHFEYRRPGLRLSDPW